MKKKDVLQFVKFSSVGIFNTVLDYGLFFIFFSLCRLDKNIAQILATGLAMLNSYILNKYWTFQKSGMVKGREVARFITVNLLALLTVLLCLNLFYDVLALYEPVNRLLVMFNASFTLSGESAVLFCKLMAMPFSFTVNFLGNRLWVFRK